MATSDPPRTKLARLRQARGLTQRELAASVGMSLANLQRLEYGMRNPPLRYLVNCAIVLGVEPAELIEDDWLEWANLDGAHPEPPS